MLPLLAAFAACLQTSAAQIHIPPAQPRFALASPMPALPAVMLDQYLDGQGEAQQMARAKGLQGRVMWIDGTANLGRLNSDEKIKDLTAKLARVGFNTVVLDVKPISGQVLYKSHIAPKITSWRGQTLPVDFDPLESMARHAHESGLQLFVSMNAFSEGHNYFRVGPGYGQPEHQSVLYVATPELIDLANRGESIGLFDSALTDDGAVHALTAAPHDSSGARCFAVSVKPDGTVVDGFELNGKQPTIPSGGVLFAGYGAAADWLRSHVSPGDRLRVESSARFLPTGEHPDQYPLMMNPSDPEVQDRELSIVREVARYPIDGMLYDDRLRFAGLDADFSDLSEGAFEKYVGHKLTWPDDVYKVTYTLQVKKGIRPGPYYEAWLVWRAIEIRNWMARVRNALRAENPRALLGIYAGSWYGEYPSFGSNYGAENLDAGFWFLTPKYAKTGFAGLLDLLVTGCYYSVPTVYEALEGGSSIGATVEAAGQLSNRVADDQCWTYAGIDPDSFKGDWEGFGRALQAACGATQGVMIFDLSHDLDWDLLAKAFKMPARAPTADLAALHEARAVRAHYRAMGVKETPIVISAGSSGTGF